jgi:response regulator NasT
MDDRALTESEAFSFIQQTAMNERTTMREIAKAVMEGSVVP